LPQRANLFDDVRAVLPRHQAMFLASAAGPEHDASAGTHQQEFGIAMFVDESVPVVANSSIFVHGAFVDHVEWSTRERSRVAQSIRCDNRMR